MLTRTQLTLLACLLGATSAAWAEKKHVDCSKQSLADTVAAADRDSTITFTGNCAGPVIVRTDGLSLAGISPAIIDGRGQNALTLDGSQRIALSSFEARGGLNGVLLINGAHATVNGVTARNNILSGISIISGSGATLADVTVSNNGLHGLDTQTAAVTTVTGSLTASNNRVFGINVNASTLTFSRANVTASGNAIGIQVAVAANAFIDSSATTLNVSGNQAVGLTVVSGSEMVAFGGTITANNNAVNGVSINSKSGLDLDAGAVLNTSNNGVHGLLLQQHSAMTVFNTPQFSGVPGFSTINSTGNTVNGVLVATGSTMTLSNQAKLVSTGNHVFGLSLDNGAAVTLVNSDITGNTARDLLMQFESRADLRSGTFGTYTCDASVHVRGSNVTCPH